MTNKEIVLQFYEEVFNQRDLSNIESYMTPDYKQHNARCEDGRDGFIKFAKTFLSMKPHMDIYQILADGDFVCVFFKCTMGNGSINKVFDLYRMRDGKLCEHWDSVEHNIQNVSPVHTNGLF